jgi:hypothetical protein
MKTKEIRQSSEPSIKLKERKEKKLKNHNIPPRISATELLSGKKL